MSHAIGKHQRSRLRVRELIEYYSQFYLLKRGDVITTGSPSGVGYGREPKVFIKPGDIIEVEVQGIGILRNPIEAERELENLH